MDRKKDTHQLFEELVKRLQKNIIVLYYLDQGIPSKQGIVDIPKRHKKKVVISSIPHRYVLSSQPKEELSFIAQ